MICPTCAAQVSPAIWKLVAAFVTAPLAIGGVVAAIVWRTQREGA
ncbi:MAG TPA: hypothetical protein VHB97_18305 [Polyangia bacterium]|nr:hypothetical protein [Polyangia bacterium]